MPKIGVTPVSFAARSHKRLGDQARFVQFDVSLTMLILWRFLSLRNWHEPG